MASDFFKAAKAFTVGSMFCACACAGTITYYGTATLGDANSPIAYAITTDGKTGSLAQSDFVSVTLGPDFNAGDQVAMNVGGPSNNISAALSATSEGLFADFGAQNWYWEADNFGSSWQLVFSPNEKIFAYIGDSYLGLDSALSGSTATVEVASVSGVSVGAPAPEPGTLAATIGGSIVLGLTAWRRRQQHS